MSMPSYTSIRRMSSASFTQSLTGYESGCGRNVAVYGSEYVYTACTWRSLVGNVGATEGGPRVQKCSECGCKR